MQVDISALPRDVLGVIFDFLEGPPSDPENYLLIAAQVCRYWRNMIAQRADPKLNIRPNPERMEIGVLFHFAANDHWDTVEHLLTMISNVEFISMHTVFAHYGKPRFMKILGRHGLQGIAPVADFIQLSPGAAEAFTRDGYTIVNSTYCVRIDSRSKRIFTNTEYVHNHKKCVAHMLTHPEDPSAAIHSLVTPAMVFAWNNPSRRREIIDDFVSLLKCHCADDVNAATIELVLARFKSYIDSASLWDLRRALILSRVRGIYLEETNLVEFSNWISVRGLRTSQFMMYISSSFNLWIPKNRQIIDVLIAGKNGHVAAALLGIYTRSPHSANYINKHLSREECRALVKVLDTMIKGPLAHIWVHHIKLTLGRYGYAKVLDS